MNAILEIISSPAAGSVLYQSSYNHWLVALSVLLAIISAYASLSASTRVERQSQFSIRMLWIGISALTLGVGIWAMHFVGMLALRLPCGVAYDPLVTLLSMMPGILVSSIALGVTWHRGAKGLPPVVGSVLLGAGIGTMHYAGMGAMQIAGYVRYEPKLFLLSIVVAVALAYVALAVKRLDTTNSKRRMFVVALILGAAGSGMHYTAMLAAYFVAGDVGAQSESAFSANNLAVMVAGITLLTSAITMVFASFSKMHGMAADLHRAEAELQIYIAKLEADSAIKAYLAEMAAALHQATSIPEFAQIFLRNATTKVGAEYGAFYVSDQTSERLVPVCGQGVLVADLDTVAIGQGLVGQCAKNLRPIILTEVEDAAMRVVWGSGELKLKSVLLLPLIQSDALLGVVVIGALRPLDSEQRSLIETLLPTVAMNLELLGRNLVSQRLVWGSQYKLGIQEIDEQHQALVGLFGALADAVKANRGHEQLGGVLKELIDYTVYHFNTEEALMRMHGYPEHSAHLKEHADLRETVVELQKKFDAGMATVTFQTVQLLNDWLTHHILKVDKHFAEFLNAKGIR